VATSFYPKRFAKFVKLQEKEKLLAEGDNAEEERKISIGAGNFSSNNIKDV